MTSGPLPFDPYATLQVLPTADQEVINAAFKALALKYHPDRDATRRAAEKMAELNKAFSILRDPTARAAHDRSRRATIAGISVAGTRYAALIVGGMSMAMGGAFLTLAVLGSFTIDIVSGRGWVCIALVIFGRWGVWATMGGALLFGLADALQLQLAITSAFGGVPNELMIAVPYLVVIVALVVWGRGIRYPGAYMRAYHRA